MKVFNANDKADYDNGFTPDIEMIELKLGNTLYPFGDIRDGQLSKAISDITGTILKSTSVPGEKMNIFYHSLDDKKTNETMLFQSL